MVKTSEFLRQLLFGDLEFTGIGFNPTPTNWERVIENNTSIIRFVYPFLMLGIIAVRFLAGIDDIGNMTLTIVGAILVLFYLVYAVQVWCKVKRQYS